MRALGVVIEPPGLDDAAGIVKVAEPVLVEALVPEPTVEGFDEGVLLRFARFDEGQLDTYLEGLRDTWVRANEIAKELGQIQSYGIYVVPYGSNEVNLVLRITYPNMATLDADKAEYDKFLAAWGKENMDSSNKTVLELYNKIRKIKGTYLLRELRMNLD